ncbi:MAG: FtsH protease activity modulator HflK [Alphaproteobacteria bacterium]|nr:FtsH protease activity modulator HflK [Alphaproteobacteria bacterium]
MSWNSGSGPGGSNPWGSPGGSQGGSGGGNGKRGGGGGPWGGGGGRGPGGFPGGPGQIPDFDQIIARIQAFIRRMLPGGGFGGRGVVLLVLAVVVVWLASGFYRVQPDEQGVVLRFGAYNRTALPGLNYHIPWPVESVLRPAVTRINRLEIGYNTQRDGSARDVPEESLMLTGDENIIDINFAVFWRISDAVPFLFNVRNPPAIVKAVAESSMREVIGRTPIQPALTEARQQIETDVTKAMQTILDSYQAGVEITQVQLQKVDPPEAVIDSFRDVQRANTDAERLRNEAEGYRNDIVPRARGDAARLTAEAEGAKQASIVEATGQTQRFLSVLAAYRMAKDVTLQRMYLETMQDILTHSPATVVDNNLKGLVPFLPLNQPDRAAPAPTSTPAPPAAGSQSKGAVR